MVDAEDEDFIRLQRAAQRMDDLFGMELPDAPGGILFGGRFTVQTPDGEERKYSAGAADADRERAFRRCMGEVVETLSQFAHLNPRTPVLSPEPGGLTAEECERLLALAGLNEGHCHWLDAVRLSDGSAAALPVALCLRDYAPAGVVLSSGCAAGRTVKDATLSAVLELIERDAVALWWRGGRQPGRFADMDLDAAIARLRGDDNDRRTWFLDLTTEIGVPVVAALSCRSDGQGIAAGFGARADRNAAGRAALNELLQMELGNRLVALKHERSGLDALAPTERDQLARMTTLHADDAILEGIESGEQAGNPAFSSLKDIVALMGASGIEVFAADLTNRDLDIPVVKAVAPLLQGHPSAVETSRLREQRRRTTLDIPSIALF
ncbi:YcaO-like family protein [Mesorhizobium sp. CAU 1741]|uniref:YcaO-like family protein n=1 Tax=Mesorhizobium sp. CAU 1741 TaxID=3140366 RepID=UPI00325A9AD8